MDPPRADHTITTIKNVRIPCAYFMGYFTLSSRPVPIHGFCTWEVCWLFCPLSSLSWSVWWSVMHWELGQCHPDVMIDGENWSHEPHNAMFYSACPWQPLSRQYCKKHRDDYWWWMVNTYNDRGEARVEWCVRLMVISRNESDERQRATPALN